MARDISAYMDEHEIQKAQADFLSKVYAWMVGGLLLTALTAWFVFQNNLWLSIASRGFLFYGLIIGELALVFTLSAGINKFSTMTAALLFLAYSLLNGVTLSVVLAFYTSESIGQVFLIASGMFGTMSLFGWLTKKDLSGMGRFMFMGLIGVIIATIVYIIFPISALNFAISVIGVIVFSGLTAWDTQKLKQMYMVQVEGGEAAAKASIIGALMLYLDFINLFLFLLRLLGSRDK